MGVPKFAWWLRNKYPSIVTGQCPAPVHGLYIDLNGVIHVCCHNDYDAAVSLLPEKKKLDCICSELELLVQTVQPNRVLYLAVDGVAPRAKMNQQRARRYMGHAIPVQGDGTASAPLADTSGKVIVEEIMREFTATEMAQVNDDLNEVRQTLLQDPLYCDTLHNACDEPEGVLSDGVGGDLFHVGDDAPQSEGACEMFCQDGGGMVEDVFNDPTKMASGHEATNEFDSNCISPGTAFMDKVSDAILAMLNEKMAGTDPMWTRLCVIYSGPNTPGEGEHKIMDFLRTQSSQNMFGDKATHVIAGLDADLIFLSLSLHITQIFILRDTTRNPYKRKAAVRQQRQQRKGQSRRKSELFEETCVILAGSDDTGTEESDGILGVPVCPSNKECSSDSSSNSCCHGGAIDNDDVAAKGTAVVEKLNMGFEYFDISAVGGCLVSEVGALCAVKGFTPATAMAFDRGALASSTGYHYFGRPYNSEDVSLPSSTQGGPPQRKRRRKIPVETENESDWRDFRPWSSPANSKIIDDIIVLATMLGNDFLPHVPSAFTGDSALDNFLEVYVSEVLPHGFLTMGFHEINLLQLRRFLEAYGRIEAVKFRRFFFTKNANREGGTCSSDSKKEKCGGSLTVSEIAVPLHSPIDDEWRETYLKTTGLEGRVLEACKEYVEGIRFVWNYYTNTKATCSWSWYYPFYYAPLALDIAMYLRNTTAENLPSPIVSSSPPDTLVQLLSTVPPTSHALLPPALGELMLHSWRSPGIATFPSQWSVDYHDSKLLHLATVMLPHADMEALQRLVEESRSKLSEEEEQRTRTFNFHFMISSRKTLFTPKGVLEEVSETFSNVLGRISCGEGVEVRQLHDIALERYRPRTYISTLDIPELSCDPNGQVPRQQRRRHRKQQLPCLSGGAKESSMTRAQVTVVHKGPCFASFLLMLGCASFFTTLLLRCSLFSSMQVLSIITCTMFFSFVLGISVHVPVSNCAPSRNNTPRTFVDWLCVECLCLNFSTRSKCFACRAPYDARRCFAVFSSVSPADPSQYDPDHSRYIEIVELSTPTCR